jgi:hypothetical protein
MGYTLFPKKVEGKTPYHDDQALGQGLGRIDIRCTLKADTSHWMKSTDCNGDVDITGLLHFNIGYNDNGSVPLRSAKVQIDIGKDVNTNGPIPTFKTCAPLSPVTGPPVEQHIVDTKKTDPQGGFSSPFGGGDLSGKSHERVKEFNVRHGWSFVAGNCSDGRYTLVTRTNFTWTRTLLEDRSGSTRSYEGAVVLHRKSGQPLVLRVKVEAQPWSWYHRARCSGLQDSCPIQPRKESLLEPEEFAQLQERIQEWIAARNHDLGATGKSSDNTSGPNTTNPQQKFQLFGWYCHLQRKPRRVSWNT